MIELEIQGMSCIHCVKAVTEALSKVPGVTLVGEIDLETGTARVEGAPEPAALIAAVEQAGYQARARG